MKKIFKYFIIILIIIISIVIYFLNNSSVNKISENEKINLTKYIDDIYNKNFSIPEFTNINNADEKWLWDNINQYLTNHPEFEVRNLECNYTYEEISNYANILYGNELNKDFPIGNEFMIYDAENNLYGVPSSSFNSFFEYQIENIEKNNNTYTVTIIDYAISFWEHFGENPTYHTNFFNINEFNLNGELSEDIIFYITELKDYKNKILENKENFTSKTLIIEFNTNTNQYHIKSCKYNYSDEDIIKNSYSKMIDSFNIYYLKYNYLDFETFNKSQVTNFNEITSIYSENGLAIYKKINNKLSFENNNAYINFTTIQTLDNPVLLSNIFSTKISNIEKTENTITCTITNILLKEPFYTNYPPLEEDLIQEPFITTFKLIKINNEWKIDEFNVVVNRDREF